MANGLGVVRLGDHTIGVCTCHQVPITVSGEVITASSNYFVNGLPVARVGDLVKGECGHIGTLIQGKPTSFANQFQVVHLGDTFAGCYSGEVIEASVDTF